MPYSDSAESEASLTSGLVGGKRAALTAHEIKNANAIRNAFKATDSVYCCSGHVPLEAKRPTVFYSITPATFITPWTQGETPISSK